MSEVTKITITLARPRPPSFPGKIAEGHFTVEGDTVLLTDKDGTAVDRYRLKQKLTPGADARAVACNLLRSRYSGSESAFNRVIAYPKIKF